MTVGGTHNKVTGRTDAGGRLHGLEKPFKGTGIKGQIVAQGGKRSPGWRLVNDDVKDQTGDQRFCLFVPVRLAGQARFVKHQCIGKRACVLGDIDAVGIDLVERIEGR